MIPQFADKGQLFDWLRANKRLLITAKKSQMKHADPVLFNHFEINEKGIAVKADANPALLDLASFPVKVVINTTNLMDSHSDVHFPGLWTKSLKETKQFNFLQEHIMQFDHVIADKVAASVRTMTWKELGYDYPGTTEALIFDATIEKRRNPFMADQYANGWVTNHSVGMRYLQIEFAVNSESKFDVEEKAVWDKYIDQIANRQAAEDQGYFWAVTEAKIIEGSAVVRGSNFATPTMTIGEEKTLPPADPITEGKPLFGLSFLTN